MSLKTFSLILFIIAFGIGCSVSNAKEETIALPTIMCGMCETNITSTLSDLEGVLKVNVDLEKKSGQVYFDAEKVSLTQIEQKISGAGYVANNTRANKSAYDKLPRCCKVDG